MDLTLLARPQFWILLALMLTAFGFLHFFLFPKQWIRRVWTDQLGLSTTPERVARVPLRERSIPARGLLSAVVFSLLLLFPFLSLMGPFGIIFALVFGSFLGPRLFGMIGRKRKSRANEQVSAFLFTWSTLLLNGDPFLVALKGATAATTDPLQSELKKLVGYLQQAKPTTAFSRMEAETESSNVKRMLGVLTQSYQRPPNALGVQMEKLAESIDLHDDFAKELRGELAGAKKQQLMVLVLIPALFAVNVFLRFDSMAFFWKTFGGQVALLIVTLLWLGQWIISGKLSKADF